MAGRTVANADLARVSADGFVCFFTDAPAHLLADVSAWFATGSLTGELGGARGGAVPHHRRRSDHDRARALSGACPRRRSAPVWSSLVPPRWVVTAAHGTTGLAAASLIVHAGLDRMSQMTRANTSFVRTGCPNSPSSRTVFTRVSAFVDWIVRYVPGITPPTPTPEPGKIGGSRQLEVPVTGRLGVPATGVAAVSLNLTVTEPDGAGYAAVIPCGPVPGTSNGDFAARQTWANAVITPVSSRGTICVVASVSTHVVIDVNGWFPSHSEMAAGR